MTRHLNTIHPEEKFENIVDIIKHSTKSNKEINLQIEESYGYDNEHQHLAKSHDNVVIIENKLLQKPFETKDLIINLPENITNHTNQNEEYPLINQIKVITAVSTYKQDSYTIANQVKYMENPENSNVDTITSANNISQMPAETKANTFIQQTENEIPSFKISNNLETQNILKTSTTADEFETTTDFTNYDLPKTEKISSVIRSVGNVKKNLTPLVSTPAKQPINQTSLEYKHKKYCRNNYNIDLYRKILGCDEDEQEDDNEKNELKESEYNSIDSQSQNYILKTSTPVHWRKSFKNIYETSSS